MLVKKVTVEKISFCLKFLSKNSRKNNFKSDFKQGKCWLKVKYDVLKIKTFLSCKSGKFAAFGQKMDTN